MEKSPDAFRTISEVAELLETPAHVLRFWESRFPQVRPVKRAGGRRYYRPSDVALLSGIKRLLHSEGLTIRGVQKVLREQGIRHVMTLADHSIVEGTLVHATDEPVAVTEAALPRVSARGDTQPANRRSSVLILEQPAAQIDESSPVESEDAAVTVTAAMENSEDTVLAGIEDALPSRADELPEVGARPVIAEMAMKDSASEAPVDAAVTATVSVPGPEEESSEIEWLPKQLRALAHARPPHQRQELRRFHDDLVALRMRLAESASGRSR